MVICLKKGRISLCKWCTYFFEIFVEFSYFLTVQLENNIRLKANCRRNFFKKKKSWKFKLLFKCQTCCDFFDSGTGCKWNSKVNKLITRNHMSGREIWHKFPECIFENFEIALVKRGHFQNFQESRGWFIPKIAPTKHDYWLITPNQQPLCIETNIF